MIHIFPKTKIEDREDVEIHTHTHTQAGTQHRTTDRLFSSKIFGLKNCLRSYSLNSKHGCYMGEVIVFIRGQGWSVKIKNVIEENINDHEIYYLCGTG